MASKEQKSASINPGQISLVSVIKETEDIDVKSWAHQISKSITLYTTKEDIGIFYESENVKYLDILTRNPTRIKHAIGDKYGSVEVTDYNLNRKFTELYNSRIKLTRELIKRNPDRLVIGS